MKAPAGIFLVLKISQYPEKDRYTPHGLTRLLLSPSMTLFWLRQGWTAVYMAVPYSEYDPNRGLNIGSLLCMKRCSALHKKSYQNVILCTYYLCSPASRPLFYRIKCIHPDAQPRPSRPHLSSKSSKHPMLVTQQQKNHAVFPRRRRSLWSEEWCAVASRGGTQL